MDPVMPAKSAVLSDSDTPPSRPSAGFLAGVVIVTAAAAYFLFGSSLAAYFGL